MPTPLFVLISLLLAGMPPAGPCSARTGGGVGVPLVIRVVPPLAGWI
jgi:hypothetical protein